jgi:hypothetical protein
MVKTVSRQVKQRYPLIIHAGWTPGWSRESGSPPTFFH